MRGDQHIKRTDTRALCLHEGSQFPVLLCRHIVIGKNLDWGKELGQSELVLLGLDALGDPVFEFAKRNRGDPNVRDAIALETPKNSLRLLPNDVDADIRVQHILDHRPSLFC